MALQNINILQPVLAAQNLLTTKLVHNYYYPFTLFTTLHALRISIAYQNNVRASNNKGKLTWGNYLAGYLIMAWGGTFMSHVLMSLPPPTLYNYHPYLNYISIHLLATAFFHWFPSALDLPTLDPLFTPIDGILRSTSIGAALTMLTSDVLPPTHIALTTSPLTPLILGAVAGSGGGVMAGTLRTWTNDWNLGTISAFKVGSGVLGSTDVWSGALAGFVYSFLTRPSLYPQLLVALKPYLGAFEANQPLQLLAPKQAQAFTSIVLITIFTWRMYSVHYKASVPEGNQKLVLATKEKVTVQVSSLDAPLSTRPRSDKSKKGKKE